MKPRSIVNSLTMFGALTLLSLTATAAATHAQDLSAPPGATPISRSSAAPQTPAQTPAPLPTQFTDPRFVQQLLATVEYQTARADSAEQQAAGWKTQADNWQSLYTSEHTRAELLKSATGDRAEASQDLKVAHKLLLDQHADDKQFIASQDERIRKLEASRFKFGLGGMALGGAVCAAATVPNLFHR